MAEILLLADDSEAQRLLRHELIRNGHVVHGARSSKEAFHVLDASEISLSIVDWFLPEGSGLRFIQDIKGSQFKDLLVLLLLGKADVESQVVGLNAGADDCLPKPIEPIVFRARVQALLRRARPLKKHGPMVAIPSASLVRVGAIELNIDSFQAQCDGRHLDLTVSEFRILATLMMNSGKALSRERLMEEVRGSGVSASGRAIDTHVFVLRKKLGEHGLAIETVRGLGYRIRS